MASKLAPPTKPPVVVIPDEVVIKPKTSLAKAIVAILSLTKFISKILRKTDKATSVCRCVDVDLIISRAPIRCKCKGVWSI